MTKYLPYGENLMKIGPVDPEINGLQEIIFKNEGLYADDPCKLCDY